jgi:transglutaminase-like putative cysteine protease
MKYRIQHRTSYSGKEPVSVGQNQAWLKPRDLPAQVCSKYRLSIEPFPSICVERLDYFGNSVTSFAFNAGYGELVVTARSQVEVKSRIVPSPEETLPWERVVASLHQGATPEAIDAAQFAFDSPRAAAAERLAEYARKSFTQGRPVLAAAIELTARIHEDFEYKPQSTTVSTPVDEVFEKRIGVCQDFAHVELAMLRSLGLGGRYVSGYLRTIPAPGKPRLVGADASHAWLSIFCGPNNVVPAEDHITVAWGRDYGDVPPLKGVFIGGGAHQLKVEVDVEPIPALS